jgi:hypothetical protein
MKRKYESTIASDKHSDTQPDYGNGRITSETKHQMTHIRNPRVEMQVKSSTYSKRETARKMNVKTPTSITGPCPTTGIPYSSVPQTRKDNNGDSRANLETAKYTNVGGHYRYVPRELP